MPPYVLDHISPFVSVGSHFPEVVESAHQSSGRFNEAIIPRSRKCVWGIGAAQAHDAALVTASAEVKWLNGWSAAATFEGEFSNVTRSYAGKGVVRYAW